MSRVAIATADGVSVCDHLARSAAFVVVEIQDGREAAREVRRRGADACGNHKSFVDLAEGCAALICGGIGEGAVGPLWAHGIEPLVLAERMPIEAALAGYLAGGLVTTDQRVCLCGH